MNAPVNWLSVRQSQGLLNTPDIATKKGLRDRAIVAVLLGCGLLRSEVASLSFKHTQQRDSRWCGVDLVGKHGRSVRLGKVTMLRGSILFRDFLMARPVRAPGSALAFRVASCLRTRIPRGTVDAPLVVNSRAAPFPASVISSTAT